MTENKNFTRTGAAFAAAAAVAVCLAIAPSASAADYSSATSSVDDATFAVNSGTLTFDGPESLFGFNLFVEVEAPDTEAFSTVKVQLDAQGDGSVSNLAGPATLYVSSPSDAEGTAAETLGTAGIYRGATASYAWVEDALQATNSPVAAVPTLDEVNTSLYSQADYDLAPESYYYGEAFDIVVSNLTSLHSGEVVDGAALTSYIFTEPKAIGTPTVVAGGYTQNIAAEWTTAPHTYASVDGYGRLYVVATLDGGVQTNTPVPTETPAPTTPPKHNGNNGHLAETGADATAPLLAGGLLLAAGAAALVAARRRTARA